MFILPLQVEGAAVDRLPVVSIGIAALCAAAFVATWLAPPSQEAELEDDYQAVTTYYREHPYLELNAGFRDRFLSARGEQSVERLHHEAAGKPVPGGALQARAEQDYLDGCVERMFAAVEASPMRRFALVPARGARQIGWLTYMFLHFGWMHILGNLLFFYLSAPMLEDVWGRRFFAVFYLLGGLVAGLAQVLFQSGSNVAIAGASGAIAACMGAFAYRYQGRQVRIGYLVFLIRIFRGTFLVPAWLWGLAWFGEQLFDFKFAGDSGVAVTAHLAGFVFGFLVAVAVGLSGFEANVLRPAVESVTVFREKAAPPSVQDALQESLRSGDSRAAATAYRNVLVAQPYDREATMGLAQQEWKAGEAQRAVGRVDKLAREMLQRDRPDEAWSLLRAPWLRADLQHFSPRTARLLLARKEAGAPFSAVLAPLLEPVAARDLSARGLTAVTEPSAAQIPAAISPIANKPGSIAAAPSAISSRGGAPGGLRIVSCKLIAIKDSALTVEADGGQQRQIALAQLSGVASAILPAIDGHPGVRTITDLILRFGDASGPTVVARIEGTRLNLPTHFPGIAPADAHRIFLGNLLAQPGVRAVIPAADLQAGRFPRFADEAALNVELYPTSQALFPS